MTAAKDMPVGTIVASAGIAYIRVFESDFIPRQWNATSGVTKTNDDIDYWIKRGAKVVRIGDGTDDD